MAYSFYARLHHRFRYQQEFTRDYSPLYTAVYGVVADWFEADPEDAVVKWLLVAGDGRSTFDVPLLLLAGLHRDVLMRIPAASELASFYPSVGGEASAEQLFGNEIYDERVPAMQGYRKPSSRLQTALRTAILARREVLQQFIQTFTVQTNETGRGIVWLLPLMFSNWEAVHLVDLGASAGLNLIAEQRTFEFFDRNGRLQLTLGQGALAQFAVKIESGHLPVVPQSRRIPHIISRTGCDLFPFELETAVDAQTLAAFIWPDQVARLQRLREGIAAFHQVQQSHAPVHLHAVDLPNELPAFLQKSVPSTPHPIILYNTFITMYLTEHGAALREIIAAWAERQQRPVLWVQWEPVKNLGGATAEEPQFGWLLWLADYWENGIHSQWRFGWTHPHGHHLQLLPGLTQWAKRNAKT